MAPALPASFSSLAPADELLRDLLAVSLTGVIFYTPLYDPAGELIDFSFAYLNPAAQRMTRLPEHPHPTLTHLQQWPQSKAHGTFAFHVEAFVTGEPRHYDVNYQADGYDNHYRLAARRSGQGLLVSFTDTADQPRTPVEEALCQSQAREREASYRVFEQTPALVQLLRAPGHRIEYANPAYQQFFAGRQLIGLDLADALPELREQGFMARLDHVYRTGETHNGAEVPFMRAAYAGQPAATTYFNFTYQAYREQGEIAGISVFAYDVTEQVLARREREAQRDQLAELFEQAPVAICVFRGADYVLELVNPPMGEMLGRPPDELVGRPFFVALPELMSQGLPALLDGVRATGQPFAAQEQAIQLGRHRPGEPGYFNFVYQPLYDAQQQVTAITCVATEVTGLVRARQASEASTYQLRLLTDALPVLISYVDRAQTYQFVNQKYQVWFGQDPATLLGRRMGEVIGEAAHGKAQEYIARALAGERVEFDATMPCREGFVRRIHTSYIPDVLDGQVRGFFSLVADVSEQVAAREQVQALNEELAAINEELQVINEELGESNTQLTRTNVDLDTFIYTASHDLKAPITNIEGLLHTLREELPAPGPAGEVPYILDLMQDSVERFKQTIEHLTDVSKLQKEYDQPAHPVPLAPIIEGVRLDLAPLLHHTGGRLKVDVRAVSTVMLSEKNLRSVVFNLLSNALKYRHPDRAPDVRVRAHLDGPYAVLEVHDNGLGLDMTRQEQAFAMFQRLHTHVEGSGVGLYMVRRLVENAGGTIAVKSTIGVGSTFIVRLPR